MNPPLTHEINPTIAAFAAATELYSTVAGKPPVEIQSQRASRSQLPDAFTSIQPMHGTRKSDGVPASRHATGDGAHQMVWLEFENGVARVVVNEAQYNEWKKEYSMKYAGTSQHRLGRDALSRG
jgi:hypothetical protein